MATLVPWNKSFLENGDVPVAIISLPDSIERRAILIEKGLPYDLGVALLHSRNYLRYSDLVSLF